MTVQTAMKMTMATFVSKNILTVGQSAARLYAYKCSQFSFGLQHISHKACLTLEYVAMHVHFSAFCDLAPNL